MYELKEKPQFADPADRADRISRVIFEWDHVNNRARVLHEGEYPPQFLITELDVEKLRNSLIILQMKALGEVQEAGKHVVGPDGQPMPKI